MGNGIRWNNSLSGVKPIPSAEGVLEVIRALCKFGDFALQFPYDDPRGFSLFTVE
jgi:hypothetical protein